MPIDEEAELVRCAKSDPVAFGKLYEANYRIILNYLYRRTLNATAAEELTSETFFKALRALPRFQSRPSIRFRSWLYRIATNEARMYWRRRKGRRESPLPPDENDLPRIVFVWPEAESPEAVREKQDRFALVHRALGRLREPYRSALILRYFEGLGPEEIGAVLGERPGTAKSLFHRGLVKLAVAIERSDATGGRRSH